MNRRELILTILAAADGRTYTPVQMQKSVFLICDQFPEIINEGPGFNFEPYDYGPFDAAVYSEIDQLARSGKAVIAPSGSGNWNTYAASDRGVEEGWQLSHSLNKDVSDYIEKVSEWVRSMTFSKLVRSIYDAYPQMRANSIFRD